jgi:hypothetical protein
MEIWIAPEEALNETSHVTCYDQRSKRNRSHKPLSRHRRRGPKWNCISLLDLVRLDAKRHISAIRNRASPIIFNLVAVYAHGYNRIEFIAMTNNHRLKLWALGYFSK